MTIGLLMFTLRLGLIFLLTEAYYLRASYLRGLGFDSGVPNKSKNERKKHCKRIVLTEVQGPPEVLPGKA